MKEVEAADLYIGVFWKGYGPYTVEEYEAAQRLGMVCLVYTKHVEGEKPSAELHTFLDRIGHVETGQVAPRRFETAEQLGKYVQQDVQALQAERFRRPPQRGSPPPVDRQRRDLLKLLNRVKEFWIEGVLEQSLHAQTLFELRKESQPEAIDHPWDHVLELPDHLPEATQTQNRIDALFDQVDRFLLILGEPGSGKTTILLALARTLVERAERDPTEPIPVVLNLASWRGAPFGDWIISELKGKYMIPTKVAEAWLEDYQILPLLDGLDEVRADQRAACVKAINGFIDTYGMGGIAVCCRLEEYTELPVRLVMNGAIRITDLRPEQVQSFLDSAGEGLQGLRAVWEEDPVIQELASSPLMLDVMSMAYQDVTMTEIKASSSDSLETRRKMLFDKYIQTMFSRRRNKTRDYSPRRTIGWLNWIAQGMQRRDVSEFDPYNISGGWLVSPRTRWTYRILSRALYVSAAVPTLWWFNDWQELPTLMWLWLLLALIVYSLMEISLVERLALSLSGFALGIEMLGGLWFVLLQVLGILMLPVFARVLTLLFGYTVIQWIIWVVLCYALTYAWAFSAGIIQYLSLRLILWLGGFTPLFLMRFLKRATRLIFLRRKGRSYIFIHRMVLEHFAALDEAHIRKLVATPVGRNPETKESDRAEN